MSLSNHPRFRHSVAFAPQSLPLRTQAVQPLKRQHRLSYLPARNGIFSPLISPRGEINIIITLFTAFSRQLSRHLARKEIKQLYSLPFLATN